jgi:hypothetical protein
MAEDDINDYAMLRLNNIERNQKYLDSLDIPKVIIPIKQKKRTKRAATTTISRKSNRLLSNNLDEETESLEEYNQNYSDFYSTVYGEVKRCRISTTSLRNYIIQHNPLHNDIISDLVVDSDVYYYFLCIIFTILQFLLFYRA